MYVAEIDAFLKACRKEEAWTHTYHHDRDLGLYAETGACPEQVLDQVHPESVATADHYPAIGANEGQLFARVLPPGVSHAKRPWQPEQRDAAGFARMQPRPREADAIDHRSGLSDPGNRTR